jgi:hypothetical protein
MTVNKTIKSKHKALEIIETIIESMKPGTTRTALESVAEWIKIAVINDRVFTMTREEREARIMELLKKTERTA